jgi:hypothetical protein
MLDARQKEFTFAISFERMSLVNSVSLQEENNLLVKLTNDQKRQHIWSRSRKQMVTEDVEILRFIT